MKISGDRIDSYQAELGRASDNKLLSKAKSSTFDLKSSEMLDAEEKKCKLLRQHKENKNIKAYQNEKWHLHFQSLAVFIREHRCFPKRSSHPKLFGWAKRQRCHYKLFQRGKQSTMTKERIEKLNSIGFVWNQQENQWEKRFNELVDYKQKYGHCHVPHKFSEYPKLATWVKIQRRQYMLYCAFYPSNITLERIERLEGLGFIWSNQDSKELFGHEDGQIKMAAVEFEEEDEVLDFKEVKTEENAIQRLVSESRAYCPSLVKSSKIESISQFETKSEEKLDGVETCDDIRIWTEILSDLVD